MIAALSDISLWQLALVAGVALVASVLGGVAGYGTGALMPLVLVPIVGPEPTVPIIALAGLLTNTSRATAYLKFIRWRHVGLVLAAGVVPCIFTAYGYTLLTGKGAMIVIGTMLMLTVPLRYLMKKHAMSLDDRGLLIGGFGYGAAVGGTVGAGVILLSVLMAAGLEGAAVIATDAVISIVIGIVRLAVFGTAGVITAQVVALALLIGIVAFPGAFLARAFVERLPIRVHTAILDVVVLVGGVVMIISAFRR